LIEALADLGGSAKASEVIFEMMAESRKKRRSSKLLMQIFEAKIFLTKAGYLACPQKGAWTLTIKGGTQPSGTVICPKFIDRIEGGDRTGLMSSSQDNKRDFESAVHNP
jgi:hypothetical protein